MLCGGAIAMGGAGLALVSNDFWLSLWYGLGF